MDLKNTKDTQQLSIAEHCKSTDSVSCTEEAFPAAAGTSLQSFLSPVKPGFRKLRGYWSELHAKRILEKQGAEVLYRNRRLPFGEVDILAQKENILYIVEVKTVSEFSAIEMCLTKRQKRALRYNRTWLEEEFGLATKILWAFVFGEKVIWLRDEGEQ